MVRFVRFSYYKTANHTTPCNAVYCSLRYGRIMLFCGRFVRFMQFGEHP